MIDRLIVNFLPKDDGITAVIRDGLTAGERVVTRGSILLAAEADRPR